MSGSLRNGSQTVTDMLIRAVIGLLRRIRDGFGFPVIGKIIQMVNTG
jgi:hypothetical protein